MTARRPHSKSPQRPPTGTLSTKKTMSPKESSSDASDEWDESEHATGWTSHQDTASDGYTSKEDHGLNSTENFRPKRYGVTLDGLYRFPLAQTKSALGSLTTLNIPSAINFCILSMTLMLSLPLFPPHYILFCALSWRLTYNAVLGLLLSLQSTSELLTRAMEYLRESNNKALYLPKMFVKIVLRGSVSRDDGETDELSNHAIPAAYPAWLCFCWLVNVVEANDVLAFTLTAIRFANLSGWWMLADNDGTLHVRKLLSAMGLESVQKMWYESSSDVGPYGATAGDGASFIPIPMTLAVILGGSIIVLSIYSKMMAHRTAGEYSWYWGDFFFRVEQHELTFTGVFELFPHPMYTIGYAWTYGCALLSRNYVVLVLALVSHLAQMMFLALVETPHIEKMYSNSAELAAKQSPSKLSILSLGGGKQNQSDNGNSADGKLNTPHTTHQDNIFVMKNFDIYRASDVSLVFMLCFLVAAVALGSVPGGPLDSDEFFIGHTLFWRFVDTLVGGGILLLQSRHGTWTKHFESIGSTPESGFESWKRLCNMFRSLRHLSFLMCAVRLFQPSTVLGNGESLTWSLLEPTQLTRILVALMLMGVSLWSFNNCYQILGDFSWFYGDFFLEPPAGQRQLSYAGIYRFLNNPDVYLGHLWMYGVALLCSNQKVAIVGFVSHALDIVFLQIVEKPHLKAIYKHRVRKNGSALSQEISRRAQKISKSDSARFFANWIRHPISTGALAPSSKQLAIAICDETGMCPSSVVVELGPGTGPFTEEIFKRIDPLDPTAPRGKYIGFELNEEFYVGLRKRFPQHKNDFVLESAERIIANLKKRGLGKADIVISGLPWAIFPDALQEKILAQVALCLKPGGHFATFAYLQGLVLPAGQKFRKRLDRHFDEVERSNVVWANIPPALVYRCRTASVPTGATTTSAVVRRKRKGNK